MKWSDLFLKPTKEYVGGTLAGFGMGLLFSQMVVHGGEQDALATTLSLFLGFLSIAVGATLARAGQQARKPVRMS